MSVKLLAWGANSHGQLGLSFKSEQELISEVKTELNLRNVRQISCGARHTIILDNDGDLYVCGKDNLCEFTKMEFDIKFKYVNCGWDVTAAISDDNRLFMWGNNGSNQLGFANLKVIMSPLELMLPNNEIAVEVKFGLKHSAILTTSHQIFITGSLKHFKNIKNMRYEIMHHNSIEWLRIKLMPDNDIITHFACGQNHIAFVKGNNVIYGIGNNKFGQCVEIEASDRILKFESGWTHNAYLTQSNQLFLYGRNNYGQLGCAYKCDKIDTPQKCPIFPIDCFSLGSEHGILASGSNLYTFGWNEHRNCGHDTDNDILIPKLLPLPYDVKKIISICAGSGYCVALVVVS